MKKLAYLLLCVTLFGQIPLSSAVLAADRLSEIENIHTEPTQDIDNNLKEVSVRHSIKINSNTYVGEDTTVKIPKDDEMVLSFLWNTIGNVGSDGSLYQYVKLSEGVVLQNVPRVSASNTVTYSYKYSSDGVNFSSIPPNNVEDIKYIGFSGNPLTYGASVSVTCDVSIAWDKATTGKNLVAEFYEKSISDETKVAQLSFDSYRMVTATYEDENGESLNPPIPHYGTLGDEYSTEVLDIPGYSLIEVPENADGTYTDEDQVVNYIYRQNPIAGADVLVKYVDNQGVPVADEETIQGNIGEEYESVQKDIDGYTFKEVQDNNAQGVFTDQVQTVTYIYTKNKAVPGTRTIKYLDTEGTSLRKDIIITPDPVHLGDPYKSYPLEFPGYTLKESQNSEGIITEEDSTTIFIYSKNEDRSHIVVHDSTLKVGEDWSPEDNFDEAIDFEGNVEDFSDIIVEGNVDTTKAGTYEVTYSIPEEHWGRSTVEGYHSATAKIVVTEEDTDTSGTNNIEVTANNKTESNVIVTDKGESTSENQTLPQTGEDKTFSHIVSIIGIALLVLGISLTTLRFNKKK
ncbi:MucBP domain-containing protein [Lactococcus petauri]|uniref:MucBP domain-containing protein n=1 Tax=Lactococcus petauri TaxID=1940789 RepID=UPI001783BB9A|nr:MucBP domain-containing protein [Lactococcus petauri]MBD5824717.1 DUF5011 domain-containing protein [Lactococcus petauri]